MSIIKSKKGISLQKRMFQMLNSEYVKLHETATKALQDAMDSNETWALNLYFKSVFPHLPVKDSTSLIDISHINTKASSISDAMRICSDLTDALLKSNSGLISFDNLKETIKVLNILKTEDKDVGLTAASNLTDEQLERIYSIININNKEPEPEEPVLN